MPIEINNLSYSYGEKTSREWQALKNINLRIEDGEFVGIMGHTGCGKSTLIQLMAGLLSPTQGQVLIDGKDINRPEYDRSILRNSLGIVFQYPEYQLFETTVEKDVAFALKHGKLTRSQIAERVEWALSLVGFSYEEIRKKSPLSLSGGEKRRVAMAGVLAAKPKILIFDEPIAGLDPHGRTAFLELVTALNRAGTTVLMVSHNVDCLGEYAKRIILLQEGNLVADGTPKEIFCNDKQLNDWKIGKGNIVTISHSLYEKGILAESDITDYHTLVETLSAVLKAGDDR